MKQFPVANFNVVRGKVRLILMLLCVIGLLIVSDLSAYAAFGDPDLTFGSNGSTTDRLYDFWPTAMARQADGKIVVVGRRYDPDFNVYALVVRRYQTDGSIDLAFGSNGLAIPYQTRGWATDVAIQNDGKIVVIGISQPGTFNQGPTAVWRFKSDGWYDPTFGTFGRVLTWGDGQCDVALYATVGRIPTTEIIGACSHGEIFRLSSNGAPNPDFGSGGLTQATNNLYSMSVRIGRIYVTINASIRRYLMDGSPDTAFGDQGVYINSSDYSCVPQIFVGTEFRSLGFQSNGTMIVAGLADFLPYYARHLSAHQLPTGDLVPGFSAVPCSGTGMDEIGANSTFPYVAIQSDNRILIAAGHMVERRSANGAFEDSYLTSSSQNSITDMLIQPDGKILTVEYVSVNNGTARARLVRSLP